MDLRTNEPKHEMDFNDDDKKMISLNAKAINMNKETKSSVQDQTPILGI